MVLVSVHSNTSKNNNTLLKNILNGLVSALKGLNDRSPADTNLNTVNALKFICGFQSSLFIHCDCIGGMELNENHLSLSWEVTSTVLQAQSRGGKEMSRLRDVLTSHTLTSVSLIWDTSASAPCLSVEHYPMETNSPYFSPPLSDYCLC